MPVYTEMLYEAKSLILGGNSDYFELYTDVVGIFRKWGYNSMLLI